jgi:hypothetical protein
MKKIWFIIAGVVLIIAVGGGAFYGGVKYGQSHFTFDNQQFPREGLAMRGGQAPGMQGSAPEGVEEGGFGGGIMGIIQSIEGNVVVVNTDAGTVKVETSDTTLIQKTMTVSVDDLEVDEQIMVMGRENDDGTITARSIMPMNQRQFGQIPEGQ